MSRLADRAQHDVEAAALRLAIVLLSEDAGRQPLHFVLNALDVVGLALHEQFDESNQNLRPVTA